MLGILIIVFKCKNFYISNSRIKITKNSRLALFSSCLLGTRMGYEVEKIMKWSHICLTDVDRVRIMTKLNVIELENQSLNLFPLMWIDCIMICEKMVFSELFSYVI